MIAETKRQMHETLEMKEDEIAQLRTRIQQVTSQKEELQEQKEKNEKSGTMGTGLNYAWGVLSMVGWFIYILQFHLLCSV